MAKNKATIEISAKDKTKGAFRSVNKGLKSVGSAATSTGAAIAALVGAAGFGALIKSSLSTADALAKTADKLGITTEALGGLQHAAELSGVSSKTLDTSLQRLQRRLSEVATVGSGAAAKSLETLGLSAKDLLEIPIEEQMGAIADAMAGLPEQSDKVRVAFGLFDTEGVNLVNTLQNGSAALREAAAESVALGVSLSRVDAAQLEAVNDSFLRVSQVVKGLGNQLSVQLAPFIKAVADQFVDAATGGVDMGEQIINAVEGIANGFGIMANGVRGVQVVFKGLQFVFAGVAQGILENINDLVGGLVYLIRLVPGFGDAFTGFTNTINAITEQAKANTVALGVELKALALSSLPSDAIANKFTEIRDAAKTNAELMAEQTTLNQATELSTQQAHNQRMVELENSKTRELVKTKKKGLTDLEKFNALSWDGQVNQVAGSLAKMTQGVTKSNKTLFRINKVAGIANAIVNTSVGVTKALTQYPPPLSFAMAGAQLAAGLAQVNAIKSTSFGSGSVPSLGGSGAGSPPVATIPTTGAPGQDLPLDNGTAKTINISFSGEGRYSKDEIRDLIDQINVEVGDGATLVTA